MKSFNEIKCALQIAAFDVMFSTVQSEKSSNERNYSFVFQ